MPQLDSAQEVQKLSLGPSAKKIKFEIPPWFSDEAKEFFKTVNVDSVKVILDHTPLLPDHRSLVYWWVSLHQAKINYENLIEEGWTHEQASVVLPPHTEN